MSHVFDCPQSESDPVAFHAEVILGSVDIRRQHGDAQLLALGNIAGDLAGRVQHRCHQRRHVLPGIVTFQIRRLVSHHRVAHCVGLIEGIVCEGHDFIVKGLGNGLLDSVGNAAPDSLLRIAVNKDLPFFLDDLHLLFGDRPADIIRLPHGIAAQLAEDLNDLLLIDDAAIGNLQNRLQFRAFVGHFFIVELIFNKPWDRIHRTGAVKGYNCRNVLDAVRLHAYAYAGHTGRFKLKDALGLALRQHFEGFRVVIGNPVHGKVRVKLLDLLLRVLDYRQVPQAQKVHFQKAQLLDGGHGILGHDGIIVPGQGNIAAHGIRRNHNTGCMGGGISRHTFQTHGRVDQLPDPGISVVHFLQLWGNLQRFLQGDMQRGGYQLGNDIRFCIGEIQRAAHVTDCAPRSHRTEGSDLRHMIRAVLTHDVLNDFSSALLAEVRIEVGHADPLGIQKTLEDQRVFHGIYFRNVHTVSSNGSSAGTTARPYRDSRFLGVADKIPYDQVVIDIPHAADDINFIVQPIQIGLGRIAVAFPEALHTELSEVFFVGIPLGHREGRQVVFMEGEFQIALFGDSHCILKRLIAIGEQGAQLFFTLEVELLRLEFHTVGIINGLARLDAQQHILHLGILAAQIVGIVGND